MRPGGCVWGVWRKSKKMPVIPSQPSSGRTSPSAPALPGSSQEYLNNPPPTPRSPLPPNVPQLPTGKHARLDSNVDHFHYDPDSPYPSRRSPQPPNSRPPSPPQPPNTGPDRSSIRKSILKGWKNSPQGGELRTSGDRRSEDRPRPSADSGNSSNGKPRRPSVLELAAPTKPGQSPEIPPPSPQFPYVQNGRVAGLSERRKSRPKMASTDLTNLSSPPDATIRPLLAARTSPPNSATSLTSSRESSDTRPSLDTRPSFDASQFEMVSPRMNGSN